jgi:DNA-binding transcriptional LysR family regulator
MGDIAERKGMPADVMMGVFTTVRLVDTGVQNLTFLAGIARIRSHYRSMDSHAAKYFTPWGAAGAGETTQALASLAVRHGRLVGFGTASMVAAINAIVAGVGVGLGAEWLLGDELLGVAVAMGVLTLVSALALFYTYQNRRYRQFEQEGDSA